MDLYAVTYTDPSEPWGDAIAGRKLYRTPTEVLDALNDTFDRYVMDTLSRTLAHEGLTYPLNNAHGASALERIEDDFSREYSVGIYHL